MTNATAQSSLPSLKTAGVTSDLVPLPWAERDLPAIEAKFLVQVTPDSVTLEGPAFTREGHLLFVCVTRGQVLRMKPSGEIEVIFEEAGLSPAGIAVHKDGRIFVACLGDFKVGSVIELDANGGNRRDVISPSQGYVPDDLVFDRQGGFYFTDFLGNATQPLGGVYYVSPDFTQITPVIPQMAIANGVALSPDESQLWATEFTNGRLHRATLTAPGVLGHIGASKTPYTFHGSAPDSMRVDSAGNVYVAMIYQGRILVFNPLGLAIAQILLPGRAQGHYLKSTSLALDCTSDRLLIVSQDETGKGAAIFEAAGLASGLKLFSHQ